MDSSATTPPHSELLDKAELAQLLGVRKGSIWQLVSRGHLPQPLRLTKRLVRWRRTTILAWLAEHEEGGRCGS
jgi:predicted DNA-binding transcriptional regulator AlpA